MSISLTNIGSSAAKSTTSQSANVGVGGVPAGSLIVVAVAADGTIGFGINTPTDTAGNTYTLVGGKAINGNNANGQLQLFYAYNSRALSNGNSITVTSSVSGTLAMSAFYATGIETTSDPGTLGSAGQAGNTTSPSDGTFWGPTNGDLIVGVVAWAGSSAVTFTQDATNAAYQNFPVKVGTSSGTDDITIAGGSVVDPDITGTNITYAPTLGSAQLWAELITEFVQAPAAAPFLGSYFDIPVHAKHRRRGDIYAAYAPAFIPPQPTPPIQSVFDMPVRRRRMTPDYTPYTSPFIPFIVPAPPPPPPPPPPPSSPYSWAKITSFSKTTWTQVGNKTAPVVDD